MNSFEFIFDEIFIKNKLLALESSDRLAFKELNFKSSAVNFLILPHVNKPYDLVLIKRVTNIKDKHSGEMAFPGGVRESKDQNLIETALRETEEEINIPREKLRVLGSFDDHITPSRYVITPIVTYMMEESQAMGKNEDEVHEIIKIPITFFASKKNYRERRYKIGRDSIGVGRYTYKSQNNKKYLIYGATCHMIVHFIDIVYNIGLKSAEVRRLTPKDLINDAFLSKYKQEKT